MASRLIEQTKTFHRKEICLPYKYKYTAHLPAEQGLDCVGQSVSRLLVLLS